MKRESSEGRETERRKSVDLTERRKQQESDQSDRDRNPDLLDTIGSEFERTIESGDPWESFTRNTKRLWRGLLG